jgi:hypothetical protein
MLHVLSLGITEGDIHNVARGICGIGDNVPTMFGMSPSLVLTIISHNFVFGSIISRLTSII